MNILAFETSCDETSVAVVKDGTEVLSCITASSLKLHAQTGGIIPENAARKQVEFITPVMEQALFEAFPQIKDTAQVILANTDAIAVTVGPGLIGSLLIGVETAKTMATLFEKPLIPVNHVQAHIYAAFLGKETPAFPLLAVIVSGGHTDFVFMKDHGSYELLGGTRDDAAGEAFDKCARILGLPYPGGPAISRAAEEYKKIHPDDKLNLFPRPMMHDDSLDVSFSGLKTAVARFVKGEHTEENYSIQQLAAEVQEAIVDSLLEKTKRAALRVNCHTIILCGGVSGNKELRKRAQTLHLNELKKPQVHVPELLYCTDNAAMVGSLAFFNNKPQNVSSVRPNPELHF